MIDNLKPELRTQHLESQFMYRLFFYPDQTHGRVNISQKHHNAVFVWLGCVVVACTLCAAPAMARPGVRQIHTTWESLMGNQLFQAYYCVGLVGDLYRAKTYKAAKTKRVIRLLQTLLQREKTFVKQIRIGRGKKQRALFRHIRGTLDLLLLALQNLEQKVDGQEGAKISQFLQYRNAAAQDLQKLLYHRGLQRRRYYRGGRRRAMSYLNQHLGLDLAYGFLIIGLVADGYFQLVLDQARTKEYLSTNLRLLQSGSQSLKYLQMRMKGSDQEYIQKIRHGMNAIYQMGMMLGQFAKTRNRSYLQRYQALRQQAWQHVQPLAAP